MSAAVGKIQAEPPTPEELRSLQLLELRKNPSRDYLQALANSLETAGACDALREILTERGVFGIEIPTSKNMGATEAGKIVRGLADFARATLEMDATGAKARERWARNPLYWGSEAASPNGRRVDLLFADKDFASATELFTWACGKDPHEFYMVVNV